MARGLQESCDDLRCFMADLDRWYLIPELYQIVIFGLARKPHEKGAYLTNTSDKSKWFYNHLGLSGGENIVFLIP